MSKLILFILLFVSNVSLFSTFNYEKDIIYQDNTRVNLLDFDPSAFDYFDQLFLSDLENNKFTNLYIELNDEVISDVHSLTVSFEGLSGEFYIVDDEISSDIFVVVLEGISIVPLNDWDPYLLNIDLSTISSGIVSFSFDYLATKPDPFLDENQIVLNKVSDSSESITFKIYNNSSLSSLNVSVDSQITQEVILQLETDYEYTIVFEGLLMDKTYIPRISFTWDNAYYDNQEQTVTTSSFTMGDTDPDSNNSGNKKWITYLTVIITIISIILLTILFTKIFTRKKQTK